MADEVVLERRGAVLVIELNRPDKLNAIDRAMAAGVAAAMDLLDTDDELAVGVIVGRGKFCAGADLDAFQRDGVPVAGDRGFAGITWRPSVKPLIAAVEGLAIGGGFEIALSCDLIVAAEGSRFGLPEVKVGMAPAGGGMLHTARLPKQVVMEWCLTGDPVKAERLYELGVVNIVTERGAALDAAVSLAERIALNAPLALAASKRVVEESRNWPREEMWERQAAICTPVTESADATEGTLAFVEKRAPVWRRR